uniref:Uncharacterized protein n=1 Tax=Nymphaea colorata TaxID=210225 RepID=A0A5K0Y3F4_9MAGN
MQPATKLKTVAGGIPSDGPSSVIPILFG